MIGLPEADQGQLPQRKGYILGSVAMPIFDTLKRLKQGQQRVLVWPLKKFDARFVCMGDYYRIKDPREMNNGFDKSLQI